MPTGNNLGNQLNVFIAEVLMVTQSDEGYPPRVQLVGVHPLVVAPGSVRYSDGSRSTVTQTVGSAIATKAGRALRTVTLSGAFGVEERGLGPYTGTGTQRFERFYHEVVRLGDAVTREQVNDAKNLLRSPGLSALVTAATFDELRTSFAVNFYDCWHKVAFEAIVQSFNFEKSARNGGALGNTSYTMQLQEVGPLVSSGLGTSLVKGLFNALSVWSTVNETLSSYTLDSVVNALVAGANVPLSQLADSISAFKAQVSGATAVMNGYIDPTRKLVANQTSALVTDGSGSVNVLALDADPSNGVASLVSHVGFAEQIVADARSVRDALVMQGPPPRVEAPAGAIDWSTLGDEHTIAGLDAADRIDQIDTVISSARFQSAVGALYGMSRADYAAYMSGTGSAGRTPGMGATLEHRVTAFDTAVSLEQRYGVTFDEILRLNGLLPGEALVTGRVLLIPQARVATTQQRIEGLPVFGSHAGREAWGRDLWADLRVDSDGRLLVCDDEDVLVQGMDWIVATFEDELDALRQQIPDVAQPFVLEQRLSALLLSDPRFVAVESITVTPDPSGAGIDVRPVVSVVNGGTVGVEA